MLQEHSWVVVGLIQRIPANRVLQIMGKVYQEGGLSVACGGRHENQLAVDGVIQSVQQALTRQHVRAPPGQHHLGDES